MHRRRWLQSAALTAAAVALDGCTAAFRSDAFDCIVDAGAAEDASHPQPARCRTLKEALDAAANSSRDPFRIQLRPGRYREKLEVSRPGIELVGAGRDFSIIAFDAASGLWRPDGAEWGTAGSATLTIRAPRFAARHLTLANDFDYPANFARTASDPARIASPQAVAVLLATGSDDAQFEDVALTGFQDTLFADAGRSRFLRCRVSGHVDFIFGAGQAVFDDCDIVSRARGGVTPQGYITAPSTPRAQPYGLVFHECRLLAEDDRVLPGETFLGRPWHPTRTFADGRYADPDAIGSTVLLRCWLDPHVAIGGWTEMGGTARDGSRTMFQPGEARFFEFESRGPGAVRNDSRRELSTAEAEGLLGTLT
jgi:pectinesterase